EILALQVLDDRDLESLAIVDIHHDRRDLLEARDGGSPSPPLPCHQLVATPGAPHDDGLKYALIADACCQVLQALFGHMFPRLTLVEPQRRQRHRRASADLGLRSPKIAQDRLEDRGPIDVRALLAHRLNLPRPREARRSLGAPRYLLHCRERTPTPACPAPARQSSTPADCATASTPAPPRSAVDGSLRDSPDRDACVDHVASVRTARSRDLERPSGTPSPSASPLVSRPGPCGWSATARSPCQRPRPPTPTTAQGLGE